MRLVLTKARKGERVAHHKYIDRRPDGKGGWVYVYASNAGTIGKKPGAPLTVPELEEAHGSLRADIAETEGALKRLHTIGRQKNLDRRGHESIVGGHEQHLAARRADLANVEQAMRDSTKTPPPASPVLSAYRGGTALAALWQQLTERVQAANPRMSEAAAGAQAAALLDRLSAREYVAMEDRLMAYGGGVGAEADPVHDLMRWYTFDSPHRGGISDALVDLSTSRTLYSDAEALSDADVDQAAAWLSEGPIRTKAEAKQKAAAKIEAEAKQAAAGASEHYKQIAQRIAAAEANFKELLTDRGFSPDQADAIFQEYKRRDVIRLDAPGGRYHVTHGALLDQDELERALQHAGATLAPAKKTRAKKPAAAVQTFDEYSAARGVPATAPSDASTHKTSRNVSGAAKKRALARQAAEGATWSEQRAQAAADYAAEQAAGTIRPPSRAEQLAQIAAGHPDLESTKAAQRLLAKRAARAAAEAPATVAGDEIPPTRPAYYAAFSALKTGDTVPHGLYIADYASSERPTWKVAARKKIGAGGVQLTLVDVSNTGGAGDDRPAVVVLAFPEKIMATEVQMHSKAQPAIVGNKLHDLVQQARHVQDTRGPVATMPGKGKKKAEQLMLFSENGRTVTDVLSKAKIRAAGGQFARHGSRGHFESHLARYREQRDAGELAGTRDDYAAHVSEGWQREQEDQQHDLLMELRHLEADARGLEGGPELRRAKRKIKRLRARLEQLGRKVA